MTTSNIAYNTITVSYIAIRISIMYSINNNYLIRDIQ